MPTFEQYHLLISGIIPVGDVILLRATHDGDDNDEGEHEENDFHYSCYC